MTLSYQSVVKADLKPLSEAVAKWRILPGQFETIGESFGNFVVKGLKESDWRGDSATAAFENMATAKKQIHAAAEEAKSVYGLLNEALDVFTSAQSRLRRLAQQVAEEQNLRITSGGQVIFDPPASSTVSARAERDYAEIAATYNAYIQSVLEDAEAADVTLHWALTQDHNGHQRGFNADTYQSLRSAAHAREQAVRDMEIASTLVRSDAGLSTKQIRQLNSILSKRQGDPYFSEMFAVRTGASDILTFWSRLVRGRRMDVDHLDLMKNLQQAASHTLATATRSDSAAMRKWEREIIELGPQKIATSDVFGDTPYGYQVMSSLMRYGEFDADFVSTYGKKLIEFDRGQLLSSNPMIPGVVYPDWAPAGDSPDALSSYLVSLSNNPDAAKQFFFSPGYSPQGSAQPNAELSYVLQDRPWPMFAEYDDLGSALKAAALGTSLDEPGLDRDLRTSNVAAQIIEMVTDDKELLQNKPELAVPFAEIGSGYMDALNWAHANAGGASDAMDENVLFGEAPTDAPTGGVGYSLGMNPQLLRLSKETAYGYLATVGQHPGAYEILSNGQNLYTVSTMERFGNDPEFARGVLYTGAYNQGVLDVSRFSGIVENYDKISAEAAEELEKASAWKSFGVKSVVTLGQGLISAQSDGIAGEVFIPIAGDAAKTAIDNYVIDDSPSEENFSEEKAEARKQFLDSGGERSKDPVAVYTRLHGLPLSSQNTWNEGAMNAHQRGWNSMTEAG